MKMKVLAAALTAICATHAHAIVSAQGLAAATAAEASFLASFSGPTVTEDFQSFVAGTQQTTFNTAVGSFTQITAGSGGVCNTLGYTCSKLGILDNGTTAADPFGGRFGIGAPARGNNYLDSFDSQSMTFTLGQYADSVGFYITDPNDVNGTMSLSLLNGDTLVIPFANIFGGAQTDGRVFYVSLFDSNGINSITFNANALKDGYGIDRVTIGTVPEPGSLALLGLGLVGLGFARRQVKA